MSAVMKNFLLSILFGSVFTSVFSQQVITAKIMDAGNKEAVSNAVITIEGDTARFQSNKLGFFQLSVDTSDFLIISHDGYETGKVKVPPKSSFAIRLNPVDTTAITEISTDYEKGTILNDYKTGIWEYFDEPDKLALKIDYDRNEIIYLEPATSDYAIEINGAFKMEKVDRQPRYLGSKSEIFQTIGETIAYPAEARAYGIQGTFNVAFTIGIDGQMQDFQVINDIGYGCGKAAVGALQQIPESWLPALLNHTAYPTRFVMPFVFLLKGKATEKAIKIDEGIMPIATYFDEFVVTAVGM